MLPLTFALPILLHYGLRRAPAKAYPLFLLGGALTWAFNIPHLSHHGLHALNPHANLASSLITAFTAVPRTPFLPYPNFVFYFMKSVHALGLAGAALALVGAVQLLRRDWKLLLTMVLFILPTYGVLAAQLEWIEGDKPRIFLTVWMPLMILLGAGLDATMRRAEWRRNLAVSAAATLTVGLVFLGLGKVHGQLEHSIYEQGLIYQRESPAFAQHQREHFGHLPLLPDYSQLTRKLHLGRKRAEQNLVAHTLFANPVPGTAPLNPWVEHAIQPATIPEPANPELSDRYVAFALDPELLLGSGQGAVTLLAQDASVDIDLSRPDQLDDLYFARKTVSWQDQDLLVAVRPKAREIRALGELFIELNGDNDFWGGMVGPIAQSGRIDDLPGPFRTEHLSPYALPGGAEPRPAHALSSSPRMITMRVPADLRVIVRYLVLNGVIGDIYRISSWSIDLNEESPGVEYHFGEPEGYL